jgi:hypothetical protein
MEDIRTYRIEEDRPEQPGREEDRRRVRELEAARSEEEVPFEIPRD